VDREAIVFWGAGSQALVLRDVISHTAYQLVAVFSDFEESPRFEAAFVTAANVPDWKSRNYPDGCAFAVAIGGKFGAVRRARIDLLDSMGFRPVTLIHPTATVLSDVIIGRACQILARAVLGVAAELGDGVIVNSNAQIDHECRIGHGTHVAPGAVILGRVNIGENVFVGANSTILPDLSIASESVIGAGAVVTTDIIEAGTYVGVPAKRLPESASAKRQD
jgi:sugar O-acyltransferase (sialic acid O-acetyltransferase NeuD family)